MKIIELEVFNNKAEFHEGFEGYLYALALEVKASDGTIGYSSNLHLHLSDVHALRLFIGESWEESECICTRHGIEGMTYVELELARMWYCCDHDGNVPTGRLAFNGYGEEYFDYQERELLIRDVTKDVNNLWARYVH